MLLLLVFLKELVIEFIVSCECNCVYKCICREIMAVVASGNVGVVVVADDGLNDADGMAYHHHPHSHHQQRQHQHHLETPSHLQPSDELDDHNQVKLQRAQPPDYRQQRMLREHHRQHGYRCPLCSRTLHDIGTMRAHLEHHYPRDSPTCPVTSCAKTFSHPNSVRNHMRLKHPVQWDQIKTLRWTYV